MILVDERVGSIELLAPLRAAGLDAESCHLDFGDVMFEGRGKQNHTLGIAVELKRVSDLVNSLESGRLAGHQLPGLVGPQGLYEWVWLLIEGFHHAITQAGLVATHPQRLRGCRTVNGVCTISEHWKALPGHPSSTELDKKVLTLEVVGGLRIRHTNTREETLRFIVTLYRWWTDKSLDQHRSHLTIYRPVPIVPVSAFRTTVATFPGIGFRRSLAVERQFGSLRRAINASIEEWAGIEVRSDEGQVRRIGRETAEKIVAFCQEG